MKKTLTIIGILVLIVIGIKLFHPVANVGQNSTSINPTVVSTHTKNNTITYKGQNGLDALTLLKHITTVEQNKSGLVVAIAGNKPTGHNYWAFYVNGKYAQVGPAQYSTKNSDTILWKVEKY